MCICQCCFRRARIAKEKCTQHTQEGGYQYHQHHHQSKSISWNRSRVRQKKKKKPSNILIALNNSTPNGKLTAIHTKAPHGKQQQTYQQAQHHDQIPLGVLGVFLWGFKFIYIYYSPRLDYRTALEQIVRRRPSSSSAMVKR